MIEPKYGEIWVLNLNPTVGREVKGTRPALVVSIDLFNQGPTDLVIIVPLTTKRKNTPLHVKIEPPEGGIKETSFIKCEDIRSVSKRRFLEKWGKVSQKTMDKVKENIRALLDL